MITEINRRHLNLIRGGARTPAPGPSFHTDPCAHSQEHALPKSPLGKIIIDAYQAGRAHGEVQHYRTGWRFGVLCGLLPGALVGGALVTIWMMLAGLL